MSDFAEFYMVLTEWGSNAPKVRHATKEDAFREAHRLAERNPGGRVHVLAHVGTLMGKVTVDEVKPG